jgi:hypothetical protein
LFGLFIRVRRCCAIVRGFLWTREIKAELANMQAISARLRMLISSNPSKTMSTCLITPPRSSHSST